MQRYNTYVVGGVEVDLNAPKFSAQKARMLNQLLFDLRGALPDVVIMKEPAPYGKYEYNFHVLDRCYDLRYECGHEYYATTDNWFQPRCPVCGAAMEKEFAQKGTMWNRREIPTKKGVLAAALSSLKKEEVK